MTPEFVRRFAPNLMLAAPDGGPGSPAAGLNAEHPYDAEGNPLPYLQEAGGPRQYFGTPGPDGLRGRLPDTGITPPEGYQGYDELVVPAPRRPANPPPFAPVMPPPSLNRRGGVPNDGLRGRLPVQDSPQNLLNGSRRPSARVMIPPYTPEVVEERIMGGIATGEIDPTIGSPGFNRGITNPDGPTLADLMARLNFTIPNIPSFLDNIGRRPEKEALRGRMDHVGPSRDEAVFRDANTLSNYPDFSTAEGLAEFNRRMGLNIGPQVRSQARQDQLHRQGATTAVASWHTTGRGADIRPRDIGGLTGQAAVDEVRRLLNTAGYPSNMEVFWESGQGRGQGTGAHVHIEPPGSPQ